MSIAEEAVVVRKCVLQLFIYFVLPLSRSLKLLGFLEDFFLKIMDSSLPSSLSSFQTESMCSSIRAIVAPAPILRAVEHASSFVITVEDASREKPEIKGERTGFITVKQCGGMSA